jgi:glycosyltransferase involved in cell wall biosynthesis
MKISIITINYNNLYGLKSTVDSVIHQTWKDFEHIIIDGGSTDGSAEFISENDELFTYWVSEPDKGIYNAMNKGIRNSTGEYLIFLNSGDSFYDQNSLGNLCLENYNEDIIYGNLQINSNNTTYIKQYPKTLSFNFFLIDSLPHQATLIKREVFNRFGFYEEDYNLSADWAHFVLVICKYCVSYRYVNKTISVFNLGGISSIDENYQIIEDEKRRFLNNNFSIFYNDYQEFSEVVAKYKLLASSRLVMIIVQIQKSKFYMSIKKIFFNTILLN